MWELRSKLSRGRISLRRFSLLATTILMVSFVVASVAPAPVFAEDAIRDGDQVYYANQTYQRLDQTDANNDGKLDALPSDQLPANTDGYTYVDASNNKAHFILTSGDAPQSSQGQYTVYDYTPPDTYTSNTPPEVISITNGTLPTAQPSSECGVDGVGWIICPVTKFLAESMDFIYNVVLVQFLTVAPLQTSSDSPLYELWKIVRDVANICFVIAFIIIVYSQLSSVGISNYGLKKMLPRLIISAVLVNVSYWLVGLAVDASNILGISIYRVFEDVRENLTGYSQMGYSGWAEVATVVLGGGGLVYGMAVVSATAWGSIVAFFAPLLVMAVIAAVVAVVILGARQAIITVCIILAPLAFVAFILPSTSKLFDRWKDLLMTMLVMFPMIAIIMGGAQLAGYAIIASANGSLIQIILGLAVQVAPLVLTPMLIKLSGSLLGRIAGIVNNPSKGLVDRTRKASENYKNMRAAQNRAKDMSKSRAGKLLNPYNHSRRLDRRRRNIEGLTRVNEDRAANNFAASERGQDIESLSRENTNQKSLIDNRFNASARGQRLEIEKRNLSTDSSNIQNRITDSLPGRQARFRQDQSDIEKSNIDNRYNDSQEGRVVDERKRKTASVKSRIDSDHQDHWNELITSDNTVKTLELQSEASEKRSQRSKIKADKMKVEIAALGDQSEHVQNLRNASPETQDLILDIARNIKLTTDQSGIIGDAKNVADHEIIKNKVKNLTDDTFTIDGVKASVYAAGIGGEPAERAVLAKAKTAISSATIDDIKNIKNTLNYLESTNPDTLLQKFKDPHSNTEQRVATAIAMSERGGPGNIALRKALDYMSEQYPDQTVDEVQDFKELLMDLSSAAKSGKDIEFYLTNSATKDGRLRTIKELSNDTGTWNALQVKSFVGMNMISQLKALRTLANQAPERYNKLVEDIKANPESYDELKPTVKDAIEYAPNAPVSDSDSRRYWSEEAIAERIGTTSFDADDPW